MEIRDMGLNWLMELTDEQRIKLQSWIDASESYYSGDCDMSDTEFDELTDELKSFQNEDLTNFVESTIYRNDSKQMEPVTEYTQEMISLFKIKYKDRSSVADIRKFIIPAMRNGKKIFKAPKLDGASLKICWDFTETFGPILKQVLTRGGLDVTVLLKDMVDIQKTKEFKKHIVCGELVINKKLFDRKYSINGDNEYEYENPRNFVGSLVKKESLGSEIVSDLSFVPCTDGINKLGDIWEEISVEDLYGLNGVIDHYKSSDFPFLCDGIVVAFDEEGERKIKDNYPLNMVAVKFPAPRARATVSGITWTQKKSGKLTPKVMINPVLLEGSTITCANGYNYKNLLDKHIMVGSIIEVEKSGDIIPIVAKVLSFPKTMKPNIPMPECDYRAVGKHLIAMDMEESRKYKFTLGLSKLNIDGIGPTLADQIGSIVNYDIIELFNSMHKPDICEILGGGKNWQKFSEFYNIKDLYFDTVIELLQFDQVGPTIAKKIAMRLSGKVDKFENVPYSVISSFSSNGANLAKVREALAKLKAYHIVVRNPVEVSSETIVYEMTGNPPGMTKEEFKKKFKEQFPNSIHAGLTKDTKYLFCDDVTKNSGKTNKARKYNIKMVLYSDALARKL